MVLIAAVLIISVIPTQTPSFLRVPDSEIQPQCVQDSAGNLFLLSYKGDPYNGNLVLRESHDEGQTFSSPIPVNSIPNSAIAVGNIRGGQLALGKDGSIHVVWNSSGPEGNKVVYANKESKARTFTRQVAVHGKTTSIDGGASIAADANGNVYVVWHANEKVGQKEVDRKLWLARSSDNGEHFSLPIPVWTRNTGACGCCSVKALTDRNGKVLIAYRAATDEIHRDTFFLESDPSGRNFTGNRVHAWDLNYCPMSSYSMLADNFDSTISWETKNQIFCRFKGKIIPISPQNQKAQHPFLCRNSVGETIVTWTIDVGWNTGGSLGWCVLDATGTPRQSGSRPGVPTWSLVSAFAKANNQFIIVY